MTQEHKVIIGPGMDGRVDGIRWLTRHWPEKYGLEPVMLPLVWKDGEPFAPKLKQITDLIDQLADSGDQVSLIGCSASGSAMLNAFIERREKVNKAVNVGGFLRPGNRQGYRSFVTRSAQSLAFQVSVLRFTELEPTLTPADRVKILTVRPVWDELVPPETVVVSGAINRTVPMIEHVLGLGLALLKYDPVIKFLKNKS